jgi:hypothetical protein
VRLTAPTLDIGDVLSDFVVTPGTIAPSGSSSSTRACTR